MSVRGAAFLGIGAMVGAGIFALLGEAGTVAGSAVWLSFLLAGIVASLLGYTTVKLGVRYPSSGGLIAYLVQGFGNGRLVGIASWLGYFAAIVIVCSMVAVAFGSYATSLFIGDDAGAAWDNVFTSLIVVAMAAINMIGAGFVDRAQSLIVFALLAVFAVFIAVTIVDIDTDLLAFDGYPPFSDIVASVALTFFAYLGFSVITFAVGDLRDPARELPKAMYMALGITTLLYVLISLGVFGTLTVDEVIGYGETAIAEAARPALGDAGFVIMAIAALLATASSVNAVLYASSGLTRSLAEIGQFPPFFGRGSRLGSHGGMLITAAIVLVIANLVDLSAIASVGSACSLLIFLLVAASGYRLRKETGSIGAIVLLGMAATAIVLVFFGIDTLRNDPETFVAIVGVAGLAVVLDLVWKRIRGPDRSPRRLATRRNDDCRDRPRPRGGAMVVLLTLASGQFLMTLDSSVMNVSIATVAKDVGTTVTGIQGAITAYTLVMAALMITGAKVGAMIGRKRAFAIGCVIYGCGSLTTALAPNLYVLLLGWSLLEGIGAALILPAIVAFVAGNFGPERRPAAYGLVAAAGAVAVAVGPLIGGFCTTTFPGGGSSPARSCWCSSSCS